MNEQSNTTLHWEFIEKEKMRPHCSGKTIIVGHTPQISGEVLDLGFLKLIDTDCSRGGWLTAYEPVHQRFLQANEEGCLRRCTPAHSLATRSLCTSSQGLIY
jgi:serine/threonine protein phosphatase 1